MAARLTSGPEPDSRMKARVTVTLKSGILDPQGKAIEGALKSLGVAGVASVRQGKVFDIELDGADKAGTEAALKEAAEKLLANTVIENYRIELRDEAMPLKGPHHWRSGSPRWRASGGVRSPNNGVSSPHGLDR